MNKKVRFDIDTKRSESIPSEPESEDPLAPNATLRKNFHSKQAENIAACNKASPLPAAKRSKLERRTPIGILEQFKDGRLNSDSDEEDQAPKEMQATSSDTEATLDLAERAVASLVEAAEEAPGGTRRSQRAPKPKDFGNVEVHGWKSKRARKS